LARRYHAIVQSSGNPTRKIAEFTVAARTTRQAKQKVRQYLRSVGLEEAADNDVDATDIGNEVLRELPLIV